MTDWQLDNDVLTLAGLEVIVQRLGVEDWEAGVRLRSWGIAPIAREGETLLVPCDEREALWLGLGCENEQRGVVTFRDEHTRAAGTAEVPRDYQLGALLRAGVAEPIGLRSGESERRLRLDFGSAEAHAGVTFALLSPEVWSARSGRALPLPLERPPLPPRLG